MTQSFNTNISDVAVHYLRFLKVPVTKSSLLSLLEQKPIGGNCKTSLTNCTIGNVAGGGSSTSQGKCTTIPASGMQNAQCGCGNANTLPVADTACNGTITL